MRAIYPNLYFETSQENSTSTVSSDKTLYEQLRFAYADILALCANVGYTDFREQMRKQGTRDLAEIDKQITFMIPKNSLFQPSRTNDWVCKKILNPNGNERRPIFPW